MQQLHVLGRLVVGGLVEMRTEPMACPHCRSTKAGVVETRTNKDGSVRRRYKCRECGVSWATKTAGEAVTVDNQIRSWRPIPEDIRQDVAAASPDLSHQQLARQYGISRDAVKRIRAEVGISRPSTTALALTVEAVEQIVAAPLSTCNAELARRHGCSRETVRKARLGVTHQEVERPDRHMGRSCHDCQHWWANRGVCSFGFPEVHLDGPVFAAECDLYAAA